MRQVYVLCILLSLFYILKHLHHDAAVEFGKKTISQVSGNKRVKFGIENIFLKSIRMSSISKNINII